VRTTTAAIASIQRSWGRPTKGDLGDGRVVVERVLDLA